MDVVGRQDPGMYAEIVGAIALPKQLGIKRQSSSKLKQTRWLLPRRNTWRGTSVFRHAGGCVWRFRKRELPQ